jgi:hypothetical protein
MGISSPHPDLNDMGSKPNVSTALAGFNDFLGVALAISRCGNGETGWHLRNLDLILVQSNAGWLG